ncbi:MAG: 6-phosphogluconolactonase, partial [Candidatus Saccharimonadales bacterium]
MASLAIQQNVVSVSNVAAEITIEVLRGAIAEKDAAFWVLSGGTAPMESYKILAANYKDTINWGKVFVAIGDERCVPYDSPDSSWTKIESTLMNPIGLSEENRLRPSSDQPSIEAAKDYEKVVAGISPNADGIPNFDMVWLGMGEDGHTLSLFPGNPALNDTESLVVAVHDSPKPPPERISLTLKALGNVSNCLILVTGIEKGEIMSKVFNGGEEYPINQVIAAIEAGGGKVT